MKRKIVLFFLLIGMSYILHAQIAFEKIFSKSNSEEVIKTFDGGYAIIGIVSSSDPNFYLIKTDSIGNQLWDKTYDLYEINTESIEQTSNGGFIIAGTTMFDEFNNSDIVIIKTNAHGDILWTKKYGGEKIDDVSQITETNDGGYILTGGTNGYKVDTTQILLMKLNSVGELQWTKQYGSTENAGARGVIQTTDGSYIIAGEIVRTTYLSENTYTTDINGYLLKTDDSGDTIWTKEYGGMNADFIYDIEQTFDGGIILTGSTLSYGSGSFDFYLIKTNSQGDTIWSKTYGGFEVDEAFEVQQTLDNGYILVGNTYSYGKGEPDIYLVKTNSIGDTLWTRVYAAGDYCNVGRSVKQSSDNGYVIAGYALNYSSGPYIYFIKTDENGCLIPFPIISGDTVLCQGDNIILDAGNTLSSFSYRWSNNETSQKISISQGGTYAVRVTDMNGCMKSDTIKITEVPLARFDLGRDTTIHANENLVLKTNSNYQSYSWSNGSSSDTLVVNVSSFGLGEHEISLIVMDQNGCSSSDTIQITINSSLGDISLDGNTNIRVYPNPCKDVLFLNVNSIQNDIEFSIFSEQGMLLSNKVFDNLVEQIDMSNYPIGIYFIAVSKFDEHFQIIKVIKE